MNRKTFITMIATAAVAAASGWQWLISDDSRSWAAETDPTRAVYETLSPQAKALYYQQSEKLTKPVPKRLVNVPDHDHGKSHQQHSEMNVSPLLRKTG